MVKDESSLCIRFTFLSSVDQEKKENSLTKYLKKKGPCPHLFFFFPFASTPIIWSGFT